MARLPDNLRIIDISHLDEYEIGNITNDKIELVSGYGEVLSITKYRHNVLAFIEAIIGLVEDAQKVEDEQKIVDKNVKGNGMGKFEIYKDKRGEYRFKFKASNGEILFVGEGYSSNSGARFGIEYIQEHVKDAEIIDYTK